jgi:hypothetical protein
MMTQNAEHRPQAGRPKESTAFTVLSVAGGVLAAICVVSGVAMLLLKAAGQHVVPLLSQIPLLLLPVAFVLLIVALLVAVRRRRLG